MLSSTVERAKFFGSVIDHPVDGPADEKGISIVNSSKNLHDSLLITAQRFHLLTERTSERILRTFI